MCWLVVLFAAGVLHLLLIPSTSTSDWTVFVVVRETCHFTPN